MMIQKLYNTRDAARFLGCSKSYLDKLRCVGDGPPYHKLGKMIRYDEADLDSWIDARMKRSTSEYETRGGRPPRLGGGV